MLLHRSRRQHYSPIFLDGTHGLVDVAALPPTTRGLWKQLKQLEPLPTSSSCGTDGPAERTSTGADPAQPFARASPAKRAKRAAT